MSSSQELCLLSLDGGGVRGLSTLLVLKRILEAINPEDPPKPCDYFHMICGTSTGGLIALMLGRMRLSIDECIEAYNEMAPHIFTKLHHRIKLSNGETRGRFDHEALEKGVKSVLVKYGFDAEELLKDSLAIGSCKTFVCATSQQTGHPVVLSSYYNERRGTDMYKITKVWEAARATSAATTFFEPVTIGDETFIDGATGANNPIQYLWTEAGDVLADRHGRLEDDIKCIVSIGTGIPSLKPFGPSLKDVAGALKAIATDTEVEADTFRKHHTKLFSSNKAFRFNVLRGLENVGLEEVEKWREIKAATRDYVQMEEVHVQIKTCALNLQEREWLKTMRRKMLNLIRPAVTTLNDDESHPTMEELQWLTHTKAYEKWKQSASGIIWYKSVDCANQNRKGVAAAVAYNTSKQYKSFAGLQFGVGEKMARALYFQCDRREAGDDYDLDASEYVNPGDILWSLICQCLLMDCETASAANQRILELDEFGRAALHDATVGRRTQPLAFLFSILLQALQLVDFRVLLALDNIHMLQESTAAGFVNALRIFVEKQLPQAGRRVPALITGSMASKFDEQLVGVPSVDDETECGECIQSLYFSEWNARRDQVANAEKGTNDWIWANEEYQRWEATSAAVLWIEGKPGSGKSVLAKSLQQRLAPSFARTGTDMSNSSGPRSNKLAVIRSKIAGGPLVADWFYSTRLGEVGMSHLSLLRSVLYQLLEQDKSLFECVASNYRKKSVAPNEEQINWQSTEINRVLEKISKSGTSVVCIIDAMDEAKDLAESSSSKVDVSRTGTILRILWNLVSGVKNSKIKFIVLSRPDPLIEMDFKKIRRTFPGTYMIVLEHENQGDIHTLIDKGLTTLREAIHTYDSDSDLDNDYTRFRGSRKHKGLISARSALSKSERTALENIRSYLKKHAEGVILWVTLILGELEDVAHNGMLSLPELEERTKALPRKLDTLYEHIVKDLQQRSNESEIVKARSTMMLISGAAYIGKFLRVREMWEALAIPNNVEEALNSGIDPIVSNRIRIKSWAGFRRQLRKRCGPFIEVVSAGDFAPPEGLEGDAQGDIGPDDIVQFMHRTVKDFLLNPERSGPLYFSEEMAAQQITLTAKIYLQIAFPEKQTPYGPRVSNRGERYWSAVIAEYENCVQEDADLNASGYEGTCANKYIEDKFSEYVQYRDKRIAEYVKYVEEKILLQFSLFTISTHFSNCSLEFGYLSRAQDVFQIPIESKRQLDRILRDPEIENVADDVRRFYPELNSKNQDLSASLNTEAVAVGEFFRYACANGLLVATRNLLEICKANSGDAGRYVYAMKNGALLAAIQHNLVPEVRVLTKGYRHQSRLLSTRGGWPIGSRQSGNKLDPFIQLAVRCGSADVVEYLFEHTDRFYARNEAVREFAVTQSDFPDIIEAAFKQRHFEKEDLPNDWDDRDSDVSSVRSSDLAELGLVHLMEKRSDARGIASQPKFRKHPNFDMDRDSFRPTRKHSSGRDVSPPRRNSRPAKKHQRTPQQEYEKLRSTCIQYALRVRKSAKSNDLLLSHQMDDMKEALRVVINTRGTDKIETNPYPRQNDEVFARSRDSLGGHEMHLQEDAFRRFVDRNVMSKPQGQEHKTNPEAERPPIPSNSLHSWGPLQPEPFGEQFGRLYPATRRFENHTPVSETPHSYGYPPYPAMGRERVNTGRSHSPAPSIPITASEPRRERRSAGKHRRESMKSPHARSADSSPQNPFHNRPPRDWEVTSQNEGPFGSQSLTAENLSRNDTGFKANTKGFIEKLFKPRRSGA